MTQDDLDALREIARDLLRFVDVRETVEECTCADDNGTCWYHLPDKEQQAARQRAFREAFREHRHRDLFASLLAAPEGGDDAAQG